MPPKKQPPKRGRTGTRTTQRPSRFSNRPRSPLNTLQQPSNDLEEAHEEQAPQIHEPTLAEQVAQLRAQLQEANQRWNGTTHSTNIAPEAMTERVSTPQPPNYAQIHSAPQTVPATYTPMAAAQQFGAQVHAVPGAVPQTTYPTMFTPSAAGHNIGYSPHPNIHHPNDFSSAALQSAIAQSAFGGIQEFSEQNATGNNPQLLFFNLGATLSESVKSKIWAKQYIDLTTMTTTSQSSLSLSMSGVNPTIALNPAKSTPPDSILTWIRLFNTYASVYLQAHPDEGPAMMTYIVRILDMSRNKKGFVWREYDEQFRRLRARCPSLPWQVVNTTLAWEAMERVEEATKEQPFRRNAGCPQGSCHKYYNTGHCPNRDTCIYKHSCSYCGKTGHSKNYCYANKDRKNHARKQDQNSNRKPSNSGKP